MFITNIKYLVFGMRFLLLILFFYPLATFSQTKSNIPNDSCTCKLSRFMDLFYIEYLGSVSPKHHNMVPIKLDLILGYEPIKRATVMFSLSKILGLSNVGGNKSYDTSNAIGGGVGYRLLSGKQGTFRGDGLDIRGIVNTSMGSSDMRFTSLDIGLHYYKRFGGLFLPAIGIGYRHINFHRHELGDVDNIYVSAGLRF